MINHVMRTEKSRVELFLRENKTLESSFREQVEKEGAIVYRNGMSFRTLGCEIDSPPVDARFDVKIYSGTVGFMLEGRD